MNVTDRVRTVKQPRGGYIKLSQFKEITFDDKHVLNDNENISPAVIGMTVDYLTRYIKSGNKEEAFRISLHGATSAQMYGVQNANAVAKELLLGINGLNDKSIINACKLVTFDVWYRRGREVASKCKGYLETNPDEATVNNVKTLVERCLAFFDRCGEITKDGFTFQGGGYTRTISTGDGDFLTADTLWELKVTKKKPDSTHTLQVLVYWIMGQHSGQEIFKNITKIGIFNPRLNIEYVLEVNSIPDDTIKTVEKDVIGY